MGSNGVNKRKLGTEYEDRAEEYLKQQGFIILERNFHSRSGEIDIVAKEDEYLVFIEVKYRRNNSSGSPLEAVNANKQKRICRTAFYYCFKHGYGERMPCRFDVIAIEGEEILHIRNAFDFRV